MHLKSAAVDLAKLSKTVPNVILFLAFFSSFFFFDRRLARATTRAQYNILSLLFDRFSHQLTDRWRFFSVYVLHIILTLLLRDSLVDRYNGCCNEHFGVYCRIAAYTRYFLKFSKSTKAWFMHIIHWTVNINIIPNGNYCSIEIEIRQYFSEYNFYMIFNFHVIS